MTTAVKLSELINGNSSQIVVPSGGINFGTDTDGSGTVTGGVLDDYEEGTWTPTINSGTARFTDAYYVKVGNLVTLSVYCDTISDQSSSTTFEIGGAPFAVANNDDAIVGQVMIRYCTFVDSITTYMTGSANIRLYKLVSQGNYSSINFNDFTNAQASIRCMFNYFTN